MILRSLLILISCLLINQHGQCQIIIERGIDSIVVNDFEGNLHVIPLYKSDSITFVVFINALQCKGCSEELVAKISGTVRNERIRAYIIFRVGNDPLIRRQQIDAILPFDTNKRFGTIYFDIENDSIIGIEPVARIRGNFNKFGVVRSPALLFLPIDKRKKTLLFRYDDLFNTKSVKLKRRVLKVLKY